MIFCRLCRQDMNHMIRKEGVCILMKKRLIATILTTILVLSLAGCKGGDDTSDTQNTDAADEVTETQTEQVQEPDGDADSKALLEKLQGLKGEESDETAVPSDDDDNNEYILSKSQNSQCFYTIDASGNMTGSYDRDEINAMIGSRGRDYVRLYDEQNGWYTDDLIASDGRFLYFKAYEMYGSDTDYCYVAYAVDTQDYEPYLLWKSEPGDGAYIDNAEYYDGALHISVNYSRNAEGHLTKRIENCYSFDEAGHKFTEESAGLEDLFDAAVAKDYGVQNRIWYYSESRQCYAHTLDEVGWVLVMKDGEYGRVTADGQFTPIKPLMEDGFPYVVTYNDDYIYFTCWNSDNSSHMLYYYDVGREKARALSLPGEEVTVLGYLDGAIYYSIQTMETYGYPHNTIYSYRGGDERSVKMYEAESVPGARITPGIEGFRIIGDRIYYITCENDRLEWVSTDAHTPDEAYKPTGCVEDDINAFKYGEVESSSEEADCPYCGTTLFRYYAENFVLDDEFSANADKITDFFRNRRDKFFGSMEESDYAPVDDSDCEYHREYPTQNCITDDLYVSDVEMLAGGKYMTVSLSGYWYGGGAHGYPNREQYLFDLESGEQIGIGDLYKGTEEEYKRIVAEATQEDFLSYTYENSPYFSNDSNEVYNQAYDEASFDNPNIEFDEEGVTVFYPPYDMGSYAAGYIDITIPYDRLNIDL